MLLQAVFSVLVAILNTVHAQTTTPPTTKPQAPSQSNSPYTCILNCVQPIAEINHCTFTDARCICDSPQILIAASSCVQKNCSPSEVSLAMQYGETMCGAFDTNGAGKSSGANAASDKGPVTNPPGGDEADGANHPPSPVAMQQSSSAATETQDIAYTPTLVASAGEALTINIWLRVAASVLGAVLVL